MWFPQDLTAVNPGTPWILLIWDLPIFILHDLFHVSDFSFLSHKSQGTNWRLQLEIPWLKSAHIITEKKLSRCPVRSYNTHPMSCRNACGQMFLNIIGSYRKSLITCKCLCFSDFRLLELGFRLTQKIPSNSMGRKAISELDRHGSSMSEGLRKQRSPKMRRKD